MHLEFLLEEPSAEAALQVLLPKMVPNVSFALHVMGGKTVLLKQLTKRLRGYARWLPSTYRIIVLVDRDEQDCQQLKQQLESSCQAAGLCSKTVATPCESIQVINRIVIEELEAWFLGDVPALQQAYPRFPDITQKSAYRDPDAIKGGTWETLERLLQKSGYFQGGLAKIELAKTVAAFMAPEHNKSESFQVFRQTLLTLTEQT